MNKDMLTPCEYGWPCSSCKLWDSNKKRCRDGKAGFSPDALTMNRIKKLEEENAKLKTDNERMKEALRQKDEQKAAEIRGAIFWHNARAQGK